MALNDQRSTCTMLRAHATAEGRSSTSQLDQDRRDIITCAAAGLVRSGAQSPSSCSSCQHHRSERLSLPRVHRACYLSCCSVRRCSGAVHEVAGSAGTSVRPRSALPPRPRRLRTLRNPNSAVLMRRLTSELWITCGSSEVRLTTHGGL